MIHRAVLSRWLKYSEAPYTSEQTSPQHFHLCSFFLPEKNYWASLQGNPFLVNCRLKTICIFVSRLFGIRAPVALYRSLGCIWESPGCVQIIITNPLWVCSDGFHVGSGEGLDCGKIINMNLGWSPSPPDVTAFIFSMWIQGPTLLSDEDN